MRNALERFLSALPNILLFAAVVVILLALLLPAYKVVPFDHNTQLVMPVKTRTIDGRPHGFGYVVESGVTISVVNKGDKKLVLVIQCEDNAGVRRLLVPLAAGETVTCKADPVIYAEMEIIVVDPEEVPQEPKINPAPPALPAGQNAGLIQI